MKHQPVFEHGAGSPCRLLPSVQRILNAPEVAALPACLPRALVRESARHILGEARASLKSAGGESVAAPTEAALIALVVDEARRRAARTLTAAINATGVVLNTGLGRARLAPSVVLAVAEVAASHSPLEIDIAGGGRGSRQHHVRDLLCELTGAADGMVVNNCAGAVLLAVSALAAGREVIISRGQLVEIGGAFRMPDIIRAGGATLVEVGSTNRTRIADYAAAITERTGLILRCHPSNFAVVGFTEETPLAQLTALGRERGIPVMDDQGSGALVAPATLGMAGQGSLPESVASGCDLVVASGDKLLGGPQAGLLLGSREAIAGIAAHPLARALRVDKLTLAALEATLQLYRDPERARMEIPTLRYLTRTLPELRRLALKLRARLQAVLPSAKYTVSVIEERSQVGGGSLPGEDLPTFCVSVRPLESAPSAESIAARLRSGTPPIFARIRSNAILFDPRTLEPEEFAHIAGAFRGLE